VRGARGPVAGREGYIWIHLQPHPGVPVVTPLLIERVCLLARTGMKSQSAPRYYHLKIACLSRLPDFEGTIDVLTENAQMG